MGSATARWLRRAAAVLFVALLGVPAAWACPHCRPEVRALAAGPDALRTALALLLPLIVIAAVGALLHVSDRPSRTHHADDAND